MEVLLGVSLAEWGDGIFGPEAAARARFGKSAADLTQREAALLAAVLPSPNKWRLDPPGPYVSQRAGTIEARMHVVARQKLDGCVWDEAAPKPKRPTSQSPTESKRKVAPKAAPPTQRNTPDIGDPQTPEDAPNVQCKARPPQK